MNRLVQAISTARMGDVRKYDLACLCKSGHLIRIFPLLNDKFESPEFILWESKSSAYRRPFGIADESELSGEEEIIHLVWSISQPP